MLALFYVLTLMMFEHEMTKSAASHAYWVVVVAGPAVVMRFLTSATFGGWELRCAERCGSWWSSPAPLGVSFLLILLGVSFAITRVGLPDGGPLGRLRDRISAARVAPPAAAFWITLVIAVLSLAALMRSRRVPDQHVRQLLDPGHRVRHPQRVRLRLRQHRGNPNQPARPRPPPPRPRPGIRSRHGQRAG